MKGETSVETYDHDVYKNMAKERGEVGIFVHVFESELTTCAGLCELV
jgi:hypothetical protein